MRLNDERVKVLKEKFQILNEELIYLDNAATTQKPEDVIDVIRKYSENYNANIHRGVYKLSEESTVLFEKSRKIIARFIGADVEEVIFTSGTTDSINSLARSIPSIIPKGKDEIVISAMEHHSNFLPWLEFSKRNKFKLKIIGLKKDLTLDMKEAKKLINEKTAIVAISHISNTLGIVNPIEKLIKLAKKYKAFSIIDAAQSVPRKEIDVKKLKADFLVFSGHKMLGPTGIGVLYGKKELLEKMEPFRFGGGMVNSATFTNAEWAPLPEKFEAGTPNITGVIGLARAVKFLEKIGMEDVERWEDRLTRYARRQLDLINGVEIYGEKQLGIISFNIEGVHPHDVASLMDSYGIAIRAGHHCTMPLMKILNVEGTCRISFYFYNTMEDIDKFIIIVNKILEKFKK